MPFLLDDPRRTLEENRNYLKSTQFILHLEMFPGVDFFCTNVSGAGGLLMPVSNVSTTFRQFSTVPSGGVVNDDLEVIFNVNENLLNFYCLHKWIQVNGLSGQPNEFITSKDREELGSQFQGLSNGHIDIFDSSNRKTFKINFLGMFPYRLMPIDFGVEITEEEPVKSSCRFKYQKVRFLTYLDRDTPSRRRTNPILLEDYYGYDKETDATPSGFGVEEGVEIEDIGNSSYSETQ